MAEIVDIIFHGIAYWQNILFVYDIHLVPYINTGLAHDIWLISPYSNMYFAIITFLLPVELLVMENKQQFTILSSDEFTMNEHFLP
jgi:hypothetical protein